MSRTQQFSLLHCFDPILTAVNYSEYFVICRVLSFSYKDYFVDCTSNHKAVQKKNDKLNVDTGNTKNIHRGSLKESDFLTNDSFYGSSSTYDL